MNSKTIIILSLIVFFSLSLNAQNVAINSTGNNPDASAMLDVSATNKGLLIPRVGLSATNSTNPVGAGVATSLLVYNTATAGTAPNNVTPGYYFWDGAKWVRIFDANTSADDYDWEVNGINVYTGHGGLYPSANVGIGTTTPGNKLTVRATTPSGYFVGSSIALNWVGTGAQAYALSVNAAKTASSTSGRSTAIIATGGNATDKYNTGISAVLNGTNDGSAIVTGIQTEYPVDGGWPQYQWIGPLSGQWGLISWSNVYFDKNNYTMGNVGIGTTTPTAQLHTTGSVRFQGAGTPSAGRVLTSDASGNATWQDPSGGGDDEDWEVIGSNVVTGHGGLYPSGNVGIRKTTPQTPLHIKANNEYLIRLEEHGTGTEYYDIKMNTDGDLEFVNDAGEMTMRLYDTPSKVAIGGISGLGYKLYIESPVSSTPQYGIYVNHSSGTTNQTWAAKINNHTTTNTLKVGIDVDVNNAGTGEHRGISVSTNANTSSTTNQYGIRSALISGGSGVQYGIWSSVSGTASGVTYSSYNSNSSSTNSTKYGIYNNVNSTGTGARYGIWNQTSENSLSTSTLSYGIYNVSNLYATTSYGVFNQSTANSNGTFYNQYNRVLGAGNANVYGDYQTISNTGTGNHYYYFADMASSNASAKYGLYVQSSGTTNNYAIYTHSGNSRFNASGQDWDFQVSTSSRPTALLVDASDNVVRFVRPTGGLTGNGTTPTGTTGPVQYVANFDIGSASGTAIGIGSVEYLFDQSSETMISNTFSPTSNGSYTLGKSTHRWSAVWAVNGVIQTSDETQKKNITSLNYGLNEVLKIRPISFEWKEQKQELVSGEVHLGFSAQDLLGIVPEVVKTHEMICVSEEPLIYEKREVANLGVYYAEIIPVLVRALQEEDAKVEGLKAKVSEQEEIIEDLQSKYEALLKRIEELEKNN